MTAIGMSQQAGAGGDREHDGRPARHRPSHLQRRQTDPEAADRRQHRADPVRDRDPEEAERRDRDADHDGTDRDLEPATRSSPVGERADQRQDEPREMEMDGGQKDDRRREVEGSDTQSIDEREGRTDRQEGDRCVRCVADPGAEPIWIAEESKPGSESDRACDRQPRQGQDASHRSSRQQEREDQEARRDRQHPKCRTRRPRARSGDLEE